jgi:hypothetical protein
MITMNPLGGKRLRETEAMAWAVKSAKTFQDNPCNSYPFAAANRSIINTEIFSFAAMMEPVSMKSPP